MHPNQRYKICICSVILGELKCQLDAIQRFTKVKFFLIPLSITFLNPTILGFLFPTKNSLTWGMICGKLNSQGIYLLEQLRKLYMSGTVIHKFLAVLKSQKILFAFPNRYFTENNRRVPLMYPHLHSVELETNIDTKCQTDFWQQTLVIVVEEIPLSICFPLLSLSDLPKSKPE